MYCQRKQFNMYCQRKKVSMYLETVVRPMFRYMGEVCSVTEKKTKKKKEKCPKKHNSCKRQNRSSGRLPQEYARAYIDAIFYDVSFRESACTCSHASREHNTPSQLCKENRAAFCLRLAKITALTAVQPESKLSRRSDISQSFQKSRRVPNPQKAHATQTKSSIRNPLRGGSSDLQGDIYPWQCASNMP